MFRLDLNAIAMTGWMMIPQYDFVSIKEYEVFNILNEEFNHIKQEKEWDFVDATIKFNWDAIDFIAAVDTVWNLTRNDLPFWVTIENWLETWGFWLQTISLRVKELSDVIIKKWMRIDFFIGFE